MNILKKTFIRIAASLILITACSAYAGEYELGAGMYDITGAPAESNMWGYVNFLSTDGLQQRLFSRAFIIADPLNTEKRIVFVSADLGAIFQSVKLEVVKRLNAKYDGLYSHDNVMLTATHTHVGTGGLSHHTLQIIAAADSSLNGYSSDNFEVVVSGIVASIERAHNNLAPGSIDLVQGELLGATRNRSLPGYIRNPDSSEYSEDTNKTMTLLKLTKDNGGEIGMINWFAIHNTSLSNQYTKLSGDNKGYAQHLFEHHKNSDHREADTFVAAFANSDEGDVVPSDGNANSAPGFEGSSDELSNAVRAGVKQYDKALELYAQAGSRMNGQLGFKHLWTNMENYSVRHEFTGNGVQPLCSAARGISFAAGGENGPANIDGITEGMTVNNTSPSLVESLFSGSAIAGVLQFLTGSLNLGEDDPCQHDKPVLLSPGNLDWVPEILPFQIFVVGDLAIIGAPAEVTTMSGRRIRAQVIDNLSAIGVNNAVIAGLANTYSGYLTTPEEYQTQQYEGASTEFGQFTLGAYLQNYSELANALVTGEVLVSSPPLGKSNETRLERSGVFSDGKFLNESWGSVLADANASYAKGQQVTVTFRGGHPKNNLQTQSSYLEVQRLEGSSWLPHAYDWDWETEYHWNRSGLDRSDIDIIWRIPNDTPSGTYRIKHDGHRKTFGRVREYSGVSRSFTVN